MSQAAFVLLLDAPAGLGGEAKYAGLMQTLSEQSAAVLGFEAPVRWTPLPAMGRMGRPASGDDEALRAARCFDELVSGGVETLFVLPVSFDFGLQQKEWLTELTRVTRRRHPGLVIHYDEMQAAHPLLLQALVDSACRQLASMQLRVPSELGLLLVANGAGDSETRSESYRLMRLLWEQLGASRADVAFVRHGVLPLPEQLRACAHSGLTWLCLPQFLWEQEQLEYARVIFRDSVAEFQQPNSRFADPLFGHPNVVAWLKQRLLELYRGRRERLDARIRSAKHLERQPGTLYGSDGASPIVPRPPGQEAPRFAGAFIARIGPPAELGTLLSWMDLGGDACLIKPTWHGYATGTYTDPVALGAVLEALPGRAVLVEGHTSSRNAEPATFDWETEAPRHRAWIREEEQRYLENTGLFALMQQKRAHYVNVTEAFWDGQCADPEVVRAALDERGVKLRFEQLLSYVPQVLFDQRGAAMLSLARFKGPTRLAISNLFGLLPEPLRAAWHGPNISYFAQVCCDLAKLYGALFRLHGLVESLSFAVRWERRGLYRSRWGNYDLIESPRIVCLSRSLAEADVLAARLQGQDVRRSAFFDVVKAELGYPVALETVPLPEALSRSFL